MNQIEQPRRRPRPQFREVAVRRREQLTPHVVRVTFSGDALAGFTPHGPAEHIKVYFPLDGQERPVMPEWGPDGPVLVEGQPRPLSRTYTPRRFFATALELDVDFVLHSDGPGAGWAEKAQQGDLVVVSGPGGPYDVEAAAGWFVIAGDESALPAIGTILEALPRSTPVQLYIEVADADEEQDLPLTPQSSVTWLHRNGVSGIPGELLRSTLGEVRLPSGEGRLFVACEASIMRDIRALMLQERGLTREAIHTHGYWKQGAANHPDHDLGQEI